MGRPQERTPALADSATSSCQPSKHSLLEGLPVVTLLVTSLGVQYSGYREATYGSKRYGLGSPLR
jgi:hypothetical protein